MKQIIVLRHAEKNGDKLTEAGIQNCDNLSKTIGLFDIVVASQTERARHTAKLLTGSMPRGDSRANIPTFPKAYKDNIIAQQRTNKLGIVGAIWSNSRLIDCARDAGLLLQGLVSELLDDMSENQRGLIVSHDGTMMALEKLLSKQSFGDTPEHSYDGLSGIIIHEDLSSERFTP